MRRAVTFTLSYHGKDTDNHQIDLYDVSQALVGFQRSIALTTHLVLHGEIITQAPALKDARVLATPPEDGSWKLVATVLAGMYAIGTAPKETPLGHIVHSVYDYVISQSLGVHVDYDKTLGQLVAERRKQHGKPISLEQHKVDSLIEKCSTALTDIHRPIAKSQTASGARIVAQVQSQKLPVGPKFSFETYEYIHSEFSDKQPHAIKGRVSSYNSNTFKGRIYVAREGRPIPFELSESCRSTSVVELITASLAANAVKNYKSEWSDIYCIVFRNTTRSGLLKSYKIIRVSHDKLSS